jgi:hypothetical protein
MSAMSHDGVSMYVLHDRTGIYRHDEESSASFRDGHRVALFEPFVAGLDTSTGD